MVVVVLTDRQMGVEESARIAAAVIQYLAGLVAPGVTPKQLAGWAAEMLAARGATPGCKGYRGFPDSMCVSVPPVFCHGIPSDVPLKEGDLVCLDLVAMKNGYYGDTAVTVPVGEVSAEKRRLIRDVYRCLTAGIDASGPGTSTTVLAQAIGKQAGKLGVRIFDQFCGHGIGQNMHEFPPIYHTASRNETCYDLRAGDSICIEPMGTHGTSEIVRAPDGWSVAAKSGMPCAHWEHTILITEDGIEVPSRWDDATFLRVFGFEQAAFNKKEG